eukprot:3825166-Pleurochrysis_carterae.AAC.1
MAAACDFPVAGQTVRGILRHISPENIIVVDNAASPRPLDNTEQVSSSSLRRRHRFCSDGIYIACVPGYQVVCTTLLGPAGCHGYNAFVFPKCRSHASRRDLDDVSSLSHEPVLLASGANDALCLVEQMRNCKARHLATRVGAWCEMRRDALELHEILYECEVPDNHSVLRLVGRWFH